MRRIRVGDLVKAREELDVPYDPIEGLGIVIDIEPWGEYNIHVIYFFEPRVIRWFEEEDLILINSAKEE